jgi:hypothetical protein
MTFPTLVTSSSAKSSIWLTMALKMTAGLLRGDDYLFRKQGQRSWDGLTIGR